MGVTVHCQGPWETVQWTDILQVSYIFYYLCDLVINSDYHPIKFQLTLQTYCRVSWEKMQTADVRLMFSDPVKILANQSYKVS